MKNSALQFLSQYQIFGLLNAKQRGLLKMASLMLGALMFILLACPAPPQPQVFVSPLEGPPGLVSGGQAEYVFHAEHSIEDNVSEADVQILAYLYTNSDSNQNKKVEVTPALTTDQNGDFSLSITMPDDAQDGDYLNFSFDFPELPYRGRSSYRVSVLPEVSVHYINRESAWGAAPVTDMLVQVFDNRNRVPLANVAWQTNVLNGPAEMVLTESGMTDDNGIARLRIDNSSAPAWDLEYAIGMTFATESGPVEAYLPGLKGVEAFDVLVSTDKPVYQPGQTIHVRGLALLKTSMKAIAEQEILVTLVAPNGTNMAQTTMTTNEYGVDSIDFPLDTQIASGDYTIRAETAFGTYDRTVEIKPYRLPRFEIAIDSDESFYMPGSTATGHINATYFFGKPVANGTVRITASAPDAPGSPDKVEIFTIEGETDEAGRYEYAIDLPETLIGVDEHESVTVDLAISVIDSASHAEETDARLTVSQQSLVIELIAESGQLHPGVENLVYIQASTPDGRPAQVALTVAVDELIQNVETDQFGLASLSVYPTSDDAYQVLTVEATSIAGQDLAQPFSQMMTLEMESAERAKLLLRPQKAELSVGEPLIVDVVVASSQDDGQSSTGDLVMIEVEKQGYLYSADVATIESGRATASIQLDPTLIGTVEVSARLVNNGGVSAVQDTRLVLINPSAMQVELETDADEYRPGDSAALDIKISQDGEAIQGMLGISIVDESVFALGAQDPAFARTYFLIDRELTRPQYGIDGFAPFGGESSPYVSDTRNASVEQLEPTIAMRQSQQVALFGLMAQELQWTEHAHASVTMPAQTDSQGNPALPMAFFATLFAVCVGRRNRKQTYVVVGLIMVSTVLWTACAAGAPAAPAGDTPAEMAAGEEMAEADMLMDASDATTATTGPGNVQSAAKPRLRQFFPETLIWLPEIETGSNGRAQIDLEIADSITTWRVSVIASDKEGNLGSAQLPMRVFQDFFVEPTLPLYLTEGDEIDVPVSVFNYLDEEQVITLDIAAAEWFEVRDDVNLTMLVAPNEVSAVYIPIRVLDAGTGDFELTATGTKMSDAVVRSVTVAANGQRQEAVINGTLTENVMHELSVDERSLDDESTVTVRFYPSPLSEMVSGLEAMLHEPNGCFEQTSSINYPNVMVLDYLRATGQAAPEIEKRASGFVERGYQRLLTFEVNNSPGGFSIYGDPPPWDMLTAYGLMQFSDQSRVTYVDPAVLNRITAYLSQQQNADGSWTSDGMFKVSGENAGDAGNVLPTAFITWGLAESGQHNDSMWMGIEYLLQAVANQDLQSNYALATTVNALIAAGAEGEEVETLLTRLIDAAEETENGALAWSAGRPTYLGGYAEAANIETSAMAAIALLKSGQHLDVAQKAIQGLQESRGINGYYYSTQATVLVLKALTLSEKWRGTDEQAIVSVTFNGVASDPINVSTVSYDRPVELTFTDVPAGINELELSINGGLLLSYQVTTESYLPWDAVVANAAADVDATMQTVGERPDVGINVTYEASEVALNASLMVETQMIVEGVSLSVANVIAEIGLPPGFRPSTADLEQVVEQTAVADYEIRRDKVVLYIAEMESDQEYTFRYRLTAQVPGTVQAPPSFAYPYYASNLRTIDEPKTLTIK